MDFLTFKGRQHRYPADIDRLVAVAKRFGFVLPRGDAELIWDEYSDSSSASWLTMDGRDDEELWSVIWSRCDPHYNSE